MGRKWEKVVKTLANLPTFLYESGRDLLINDNNT